MPIPNSLRHPLFERLGRSSSLRTLVERFLLKRSIIFSSFPTYRVYFTLHGLLSIFSDAHTKSTFSAPALCSAVLYSCLIVLTPRLWIELIGVGAHATSVAEATEDRIVERPSPSGKRHSGKATRERRRAQSGNTGEAFRFFFSLFTSLILYSRSISAQQWEVATEDLSW